MIDASEAREISFSNVSMDTFMKIDEIEEDIKKQALKGKMKTKDFRITSGEDKVIKRYFENLGYGVETKIVGEQVNQYYIKEVTSIFVYWY